MRAEIILVSLVRILRMTETSSDEFRSSGFVVVILIGVLVVGPEERTGLAEN